MGSTIDIQLCIGRHSLRISSYETDIQLCIQLIILGIQEYRALRSLFSSTFNTIHTLNVELWDQHSALHSITICLEYRTMGSTFSSAFENTHLEYRAVGSIFSSEFKIIHSLNIELWVRHSALHSKNIHIEHRAMRSTLSSAFNTIHTLNIEL